MSRNLTKHWRPLLLLIGLLSLGLGITLWQPVDIPTLLHWGERLAAHPAMMVAVTGLMAALFALALPGSLCIWLLAPFHPPLIATALMVAGSVTGAAGAYRLSRRLGRNWKPIGASGRVVRILERRGGFLAQCALRILPGFPHSVTNYAAGLLKLPMPTFLAAAITGLSVKWGIYVSAIHGAVVALEAGEPMRAETLAPLFALTVLLLAGAWAKSKWTV
jgi:uncharacterized membrane protein YdjX (TVP38/TMEM64 family)